MAPSRRKIRPSPSAAVRSARWRGWLRRRCVVLFALAALGLVAGAFAWPNHVGSEMGRNETMAIATLHTYSGAQAIFRREHSERRYARSLHELYRGEGATPWELLPLRLARATVPGLGCSGYYYVMVPPEGVPPSEWEFAPELIAVPCVYNETGLNTFVIDAWGTVWMRDTGGELPAELIYHLGDHGWVGPDELAGYCE